ncbi:MAG TPA: hypothetical protein VH880_05365 [Anaeromyxobacteraceae bacterium]|jgi:hypothetical protein
MSDQAHAPGGHPPAEADRIGTWTIVAVGVAALVLFAASSAVTLAWMHRARAQMNPAYDQAPRAAGQRKIGIVEQQLFENANRAESMRRAQLRRLSSYGWVDREKGVVRIPVERAMDLAARGERP